MAEQKSIKLPFDTFYASRFWSTGNYAIVEDTEKHELWGADLTTDKSAQDLLTAGVPRTTK